MEKNNYLHETFLTCFFPSDEFLYCLKKEKVIKQKMSSYNLEFGIYVHYTKSHCHAEKNTKFSCHYGNVIEFF